MNPSTRMPTVAAPRAALYASALALLLAAPAYAIGPEAPSISSITTCATVSS